jgi:hypothetical protein
LRAINLLNQFKQNTLELADYLNSGVLNRKKHWRKYHRSLRIARRIPQADEDIRVLSKVDSVFYQNWNVPKIRTSISIPLLSIGVLFVQLLYVFLLSPNLPFIIGMILFLVFSLANFTLSHVVFHWFFGTVLGIKFNSVFIFKSSFRNARFPFSVIGKIMPAFGIKYEVYSFLKADKWKRTLMFISAPILTWIWFIINYLFLLILYPIESSFLSILGLFLVITFIINQFLSFYGKGDFWKASRDYK